MPNKVETFDLWQYFCGQLYDPLMRCRLDFLGSIDEKILKAAVLLSMETVPLLSCTFEVARQRPRWVDRHFTGEDIVHVVEGDGQFYMGQRLNIYREPPVKLFLIKGAKHDSLVAIMSHLISDGAGFKDYLYLLSRLYKELAAGRQPSRAKSLPRGTWPLFEGQNLFQLISLWLTSYKSFQKSRKKQQPFPSAFKKETMMLRASFNPKAFARLKGFAKQQGATVNDVLMALYARALAKKTATDTVVLPATMDLRKFIPEGETVGIGNFSSYCTCTIQVSPGDSLAWTVKQVHEEMDRHKKSNGVLKSIALWNLATGVLPYPILKMVQRAVITHPYITFTNVGILQEKNLDFGPELVSAYVTGSIKPLPYLQLSVCTFKDTCTLGVNLHGSPRDRQWVEEILGEIVATEFS